MKYGTYVAAIRSNASGLGDAAEAAGLAAPVPSCPEWTVDDLTLHIGRVMRLWAGVVASRSTEPPDFSAMNASAPDGVDRFEWVRRGGAELADVLDAAPEETPIWTFAGPGIVRFWARRQAHEVTIHRYDAELANGEPGSVDGHLAADGVNEYFELLALRPAASAMQGNGETVQFRCIDHGAAWVAELTPDGVILRAEHAESDVVVSGPASAVMLAVWNRIGPDDERLEVVGDEGLLDRWRRLTTF
jgi:uncharacterized protein (TIGR03083 family)